MDQKDIDALRAKRNFRLLADDYMAIVDKVNMVDRKKGGKQLKVSLMVGFGSTTHDVLQYLHKDKPALLKFLDACGIADIANYKDAEGKELLISLLPTDDDDFPHDVYSYLPLKKASEDEAEAAEEAGAEPTQIEGGLV